MAGKKPRAQPRRTGRRGLSQGPAAALPSRNDLSAHTGSPQTSSSSPPPPALPSPSPAGLRRRRQRRPRGAGGQRGLTAPQGRARPGRTAGQLRFPPRRRSRSAARGEPHPGGAGGAALGAGGRPAGRRSVAAWTPSWRWRAAGRRASGGRAACSCPAARAPRCAPHTPSSAEPRPPAAFA